MQQCMEDAQPQAIKNFLLGYIQISIAMLVVQFEFCKVVLLERFTLNLTDEGYPRSMQLLLTVVAADGITYRRVGYLTINETVTIVK